MKRKTKSLCATLAFSILFTFGVCGVTTYAAEDSVPALSEDVVVSSRFYELLFGADKEDKETTADTVKLIPGGDVFGVKIESDAVIVADNKEALATDASFPLCIGDRIVRLGDREVKSAKEVRDILTEAENTLSVTVERNDGTYTFTIPLCGEKGNRRLGITLRDSAAGIGTVTFVDPETKAFGGLGHAISDPDTGELIPMTEGEVTTVILGGVRKGEAGKPGELHGVLKNEVIGSLHQNDVCGVFGKLNVETDGEDVLPIGKREELREGAATIVSTVKNGEKAEYAVAISDIHVDETGSKCFTVTVTDETLISLTGGIVRGMSGSPILQDGKLVGAVTHVLISDPKVGYGIFIENMLDAMKNADDTQKNAA